ncbi:MAG: DEAD/DEAH box helicase [Nitrosomonas sp.]|nr:DEAD/DEAH box helicase [Nitrosomonas sp.]MDP1951672.1 DEAD/DEAH box helicase [Nitrosomonas sp.]
MKKKLLARYDKLSQDEQDILLALSIIYIPIHQTQLQQLLTKSGCVSAAARTIVAKPLHEKLAKLGLIDKTHAGWVCAQAISETLIKKAAEKTVIFSQLAPLVVNNTASSFYNSAHLHEIKKLRIYLHQRNEAAFITQLEQFARDHLDFLIKVLDQIFFLDFDIHWFNQLPLAIRMAVLLHYQLSLHLYVHHCTLQYQLMNESFSETKNHSKCVIHQYIELHLIRGDLQGMEALLEGDDTALAYLLMGMLRFLQNRNEESLACFDTAFKRLKKENPKRNICLDGQAGYFFHLALLRSQTTENLLTLRKQLQQAIKQQGSHDFFQLAGQRLLKGLDVYQAKARARDNISHLLFQYHAFSYDLLFCALLLHWLGELDEQVKIDPTIIINLNKFCHQADKNNYFWFASVSSNLLARLSVSNATTRKIAEKYSTSEFNAIIDLLPRVDPWQRSLDALIRLGNADIKKINGTENYGALRLIWIVDMADQDIYLVAREQRLGKNGRWTKGRPIATKRLHQSLGEFDYLTEHDRRICSHIELGYENAYYSYYRKEVYQLNERAVVEAAGHPNIYWNDAGNFDSPISISTAEIQLLVSEQKDQLLIALSPAPQDEENFIFERTASDDILVYKVEPQHHQVATILGRSGLLVPKKARQQVIDSISAIASMLTVQSDIGGQSSRAEAVEADSRLHLHLQSVGEGIQIDIFVQPFSHGGPVYKPGIGGATVLAEIDGKQLQTTRNFTQEQQFLDQVLENCPGLYHTTNAKWILDDAEMALEALLQLQALGDFAVLEWPKGKAIRISKETGLSQAQFSVRKEKDWFSVSGEIQIDDHQVMEMQNLMSLLAATPGRFLKLEDGQIIALTQELRQRLEDLSGFGEAHGENLRFHPLAAQALDDITEGMNVTAGKHWQQQLEKLSALADLDPQLPTTLQGELREYQLQGYQWMARLAHLGAGACLADDMGLGKTIQALALILSRTTGGPTLILAPTSVCNNWLEEAQRFAPTLNVRYFGSGDRQQQLDDAGPFDLIVCSYGLLQTEADKLAGKLWHTIVADEAQAIKNPLTQRSKAAMNLQGDFKIITTGTPIENHLGELWNLFNFINPGLLGSLKKFNERYAQKIENQKDHATQQRLKKLLQPFILRRLKNDVLTELPARTEVTLHIELSVEERTLYEALRRNAMQTMMESQAQTAPPGQQHLKVLAEIMKLRRACCHPRLVLEQSDISSSKLQTFEALVDELIANHHKALVFSQFVAHLTLIRELLDRKGISYQYLDGSTTMQKRKAAVNTFQSGQGDLFLISLKAGGAGLNLTAADYVVHMDPWWNPAVEDQASDRAHRMGQKRPVTIYRLVAKDTIEDKIVDLHRHKRDLANSLLKGGDISGKMSVKDMLELIGDLD